MRKFASSLRRYRTDLWPDKVAFAEKTAVPAAAEGRDTSPAPSSGAVWNMAARSSAPSAPNFPVKGWPKLCSTIPFFPTATCLPTCSRCAIAALRACWKSFPRGRALLLWLLQNCNDGRQKTLFCTAANLLPLDVLESAVQQIRQQIEQEPDPKKKASLARAALQAAASGCGISLKLHKKKP